MMVLEVSRDRHLEEHHGQGQDDGRGDAGQRDDRVVARNTARKTTSGRPGWPGFQDGEGAGGGGHALAAVEIRRRG